MSCQVQSGRIHAEATGAHAVLPGPGWLVHWTIARLWREEARARPPRRAGATGSVTRPARHMVGGRVA
jgi:hypothetical protein